MKYITLFETAAAYNAVTLDLPNVSLIEENMSVRYNPYVVLETRLVAKFNVTNTSSPTQIANFDYSNNFSVIEIDDVVQSSVVNAYTFSTTGEHTVKYTLTDITHIGYGQFQQCTNLTNITIPDSVTSIDMFAFYGCTGLINVTIGSGVTSICDSAFYQCSGITSIDIPSGITSIGRAVFYRCTNLTSVTIPDSVTSIGKDAFYCCTGLTNVTIGSGVISIGNGVFQWCSSLTSITSNAVTAPIIQNDTFQGVHIDGTLYVPIGSSKYDTWMKTGSYYLGKYNWTKVEQ